MKSSFILILSLLIIISCASPEKLLQRGDYDAVIEKSVKNLIKNPGSEEDASMLDKAYKLANDRDLERVKYLKMEGNPNSWAITSAAMLFPVPLKPETSITP